MIQTIGGWKEIKLGRVFKSSGCVVGTEQERSMIIESQYMAYLGDKNPFCRGMDELLDAYGSAKIKDRLVLINDGAAVWMEHNWCKDMY